MLDKTVTYRLIGAGIVIVAAAVILPQVMDGQRPPELGVKVAVSQAPAFPDVKISSAKPVDSLPETHMSQAHSSQSQSDSSQSHQHSTPPVSVTDKNSTKAVPNKQAQDIQLVPKQGQAPKVAATPVPVKAAKQKVVPPKPAPQLAGRWTVQIATFANEDNAKRLVDKLKKANYSAYSVTNSSLNKVYVGPEFDRSASEKSLADIKKQFGLKGIVTKFSEN